MADVGRIVTVANIWIQEQDIWSLMFGEWQQWLQYGDRTGYMVADVGRIATLANIWIQEQDIWSRMLEELQQWLQY